MHISTYTKWKVLTLFVALLFDKSQFKCKVNISNRRFHCQLKSPDISKKFMVMVMKNCEY